MFWKRLDVFSGKEWTFIILGILSEDIMSSLSQVHPECDLLFYSLHKLYINQDSPKRQDYEEAVDRTERPLLANLLFLQGSQLCLLLCL